MKTGLQRKQQELVPCQYCGNLFKTGGIYQHIKLKHRLVIEKIPLFKVVDSKERNSAINMPVVPLIPRKNRYTESDLDVLIKDKLTNCRYPEVINFIQTARAIERSIDRIKEIIFNEGITNIRTCVARLYGELTWPEPQDYDTNTTGYLVSGLHNA